MIGVEHLINQRVRDIQVSGIRKFANRVANVQGAISLTLGQPDFPTPEHIKERAQLAIQADKTTYTHNAGLLELRQAASRFLDSKYGLSYDPVNEVIVTNGASEAIDITLRTILEEGVEVILPAPVYPGYEPVIRMCGAKVVHVDTRDTAFKVTAAQIAAALTEKTRCIILPYPSNPTGCVLTADDVREIANLVRDRGLFVISDEIYAELLYSGEHVSIANQPGMREKTIVIGGLSKSHSMTGWRIGFTFAPASLSQHLLKVHQYNTSCASSISQYAALEALTVGVDDAAPMRAEYLKRRDYVYERLVAIGFDVVKPDGAFYLFPSIAKWGMSSLEFATALLERGKVAVVPGDAFSAYGEGYVRISYATSMDLLEEALNRIDTFVKKV